MQVEAWLARAARTAPGAVAVETAQRSLSYAELWDVAARAAAELAARGARRGEQVAIVLPAGIDFAIALHACMLLGAVAVPVDLRLTRGERERTTAAARLAVDEPLVSVATTGGPTDAPAEGRFARSRPPIERSR